MADGSLFGETTDSWNTFGCTGAEKNNLTHFFSKPESMAVKSDSADCCGEKNMS